MPGLTGVLTNAVAGAMDIGRLVVPVACAGCGREDVRWCDECAELWWAAPWRSEDGAGRLDVAGRVPLPVWSVQPLAGAAHHMVAAWKRDRRDLDEFFWGAAARLGGALAPALDVGEPLAVVPIPSRAASRRRRGVDLPAMVAAGVVAGLRGRGVDADVTACLHVTGRSARRSGARHRWSGARRELRLAGKVPARPVVLVDDVMTTGASMAAAASVLEGVAAPTIAGVTLAAAEPRGAGADRPLAAVGNISADSASVARRRAIVSEVETSEGTPSASGR